MSKAKTTRLSSLKGKEKDVSKNQTWFTTIAALK